MIKALLMAAVLAAAPTLPVPVEEPPPAGSTPDEVEPGADEHIARSVALYQQERFVEAAAAMELAYQARPRPLYLFNAAQAYRRANRPREALVYYHRFLDVAPEASQASETRGYIKNMELLQAEEERAAQEAAAREQAQAAAARSQVDLTLTRGRAERSEQARRRVRTRALIISSVAGAVVIGVAVTLSVILTRDPSTDWGFHAVTF